MIAGYSTSFIDFEDKVALILFFIGCNFCCSYCANYKLRTADSGIDPIIIAEHIRKNKDFYEAVVLSGGEPCFWQKFLINFAEKMRKCLSIPIKLDTNGTYFDVVEELVTKKLIDVVAVDIKQDIYNFQKMSDTIGKRFTTSCAVNILKTINFLQESDIKTIFRTTLIPSITESDFSNMLRMLMVNWDKIKNEFHLQYFNPDLSEHLVPGPYLKPERFVKILEAYDINFKLKGF